jgi:hypothetical protein
MPCNLNQSKKGASCPKIHQLSDPLSSTNIFRPPPRRPSHDDPSSPIKRERIAGKAAIRQPDTLVIGNRELRVGALILHRDLAAGQRAAGAARRRAVAAQVRRADRVRRLEVLQVEARRLRQRGVGRQLVRDAEAWGSRVGRHGQDRGVAVEGGVEGDVDCEGGGQGGQEEEFGEHRGGGGAGWWFVGKAR